MKTRPHCGRGVQRAWLVASLASLLTASAATVTDDFAVSHNYLADGPGGTIWEGIYLGAGSVTGGLNGGGPGQTLVADATVTTPGRLTLQTRHTDWENGNNDGFFLFKTVPGDFQAEVQLTRFDIQAYHCTGLMVRVPDPAQAAAGEDYLAWFRFEQYGIANYLRNTTAGSSENVWPANNPNTNYWLRVERVGNTFHFYEKATAGATWTLAMSRTRNDLAGLPLQVGVMNATFSGNSPVAQFDNFSLTGPQVGNGAVTLLTQPQSQSVVQGQPVTFSAQPNGVPPIALQWYRDNVPIPGATRAQLSFIPTLADSNTVYHLKATNTVGVTTYGVASSNAVLMVLPDLAPPQLVAAKGAGLQGVNLFFNEPLRADSISNRANYTLTAEGAGAVPVLTAGPGPDPAVISLTTGPLTPGQACTVTVSAVRDAAGNPVAPGAQAAFLASAQVVWDVGLPQPGGGFVTAGAGRALSAGGAGILSSDDQFTLAFQPMSGDFDLQTRVRGMDTAGPLAAFGLMARAGLGSNDAFAATWASPGAGGASFQSRSNLGLAAVRTGFYPVNYPDTYLRLRRQGAAFSGYASFDGLTWAWLGTATLNVSNTLLVGLAGSSGSPGAATRAWIEDASATASLTAVTNPPVPFEPLMACSRRTALVFSEILYHPLNPPGTNSLEFVELFNTGEVPERLDGHRLSGDIDYAFPAGTVLAPGQFLVVARDPVFLRAVYGLADPVLGPFTNNLPNGGGVLRLRNELDGTLLETRYETRDPWPVAADGAGHSLVLARPSYGESDPRAWSASDTIGGTPGHPHHRGAEPLRPVCINEWLAHTDPPEVDTIELFNRSSQTLALAGCALTDDATTNRFVFPAGTTIGPRGFLRLTAPQLGFNLSASGETVLLKNPSGTRVLDAVRFGPQENGVSSGRHPDGDESLSRLAVTTPGTNNAAPLLSSVVINEIMYHPMAGDAGQYVELHNRGAGAVPLGGWRLEGGIGFTFPSNLVLAPNGYVVVARDLACLLTNYPHLNLTNAAGNFSGSLAHSGERVALARPDIVIGTNTAGIVETNLIHVVVNEVAYGTGQRWGRWADGGGSSLELIDPRADNRLAAHWADSDETAKAPWTPVDFTGMLDHGTGGSQGTPNRLELFLYGAGECLVDSVECRQGTGTNRVLNPGFESGTNGWVFQGTHRTSTVQTGGAQAGSRALHVVATDRGDTGANRIRYAIQTMNTGTNGTLRAQARWLRGSPNLFLRLRGSWLEVAATLRLPSNPGTPGQPNSRRLPNAGPAIDRVAHSPVLPAAGQPVVVTARCTDPDGLASRVLHYRLDPAAADTPVVMTDDGTGGDAVAGDGLFSGTIPGQAVGAQVAFYVEATDAAAVPVAGRFPAGAPQQECLIRFGESTPAGPLGVYRIWMTRTNADWWAARERNSNEPLDATFVYGNWRAIYNISALYSGSPWHVIWGGYNGPLGNVCDYQFNFDADEPLMGSRSYVLNGQTVDEGNFTNDSTMQGETLSYWFGRQLGLIYNHKRYVHVFFNSQRRGMLYADHQQPNSDGLDQYFSGATGRLYKVENGFEFADNGLDFVANSARLEVYTTTGGAKKPARYRWNFIPRAVGDNPLNDFTHLFTLVDAVNAPGSDPYLKAVGLMADIDQWMRHFAVQHMAGNWDTYGSASGKNCFLYKADDEPWRLLLWDMDLTMGKGGEAPTDPLPVAEDPVVQRMYNEPQFGRLFWHSLNTLAQGPMQPAAYQPLIRARYDYLRGAGVPLQDPATLINWVDARRAYILASVPNALFSVDAAAAFTTNRDVITLTGSAPIWARSITLNGQAWPVTWTGLTTWRAQVPLGPGTNTLVWRAADDAGQTPGGGSRTITVHNTMAPVAPEGWVVLNEILHHPALPGAGFVELFNTHSAATFDLAGWRLNGLDHTFPAGTLLGPRQFITLAEDPYLASALHGVTNAVFTPAPGRVDPDGETFTLYRPSTPPGLERVVDRVRYRATMPFPAAANLPGRSLQLVDATRDTWRAGNWNTLTNGPAATPGATNTLAAPLPAFPSLWINEVQPQNLTGPTNTGGARTPWIEIYNPSTNAVGLGGLYLSDTYSNLTACTFPAGATVAPGQFKLVFADSQTGLSTADQPHTSFTLNANAGSVILSRLHNGSPQVLDYLDYTGVPANAAYGSVPDGQAFDRRLLFYATPGATNNGASAPLTVVINEWMAANTRTLVNPVNGRFSDWFELYNHGSQPAQLAGFRLSDSLASPARFTIPPGYTIPPGGFLLVWADDVVTNGTPDLHVPFKLDNAGEALVLSGPDGTVVDYVAFGPQSDDWSQGRFPDGTTAVFDMPAATPGAPNAIPNAPPVIGPLSNRVAHAGQTVRLTIPATDPQMPVQSLIHTLLGGPPGATLGPLNGLFEWAVPLDAPPGPRRIEVQVTDTGTPPLASTGSFDIIVGAPLRFSGVQPAGSGQVRLTFQTLAGCAYQAHYKDDLSWPEWLVLPGIHAGSGGEISILDAPPGPQRYYRLSLLP